MALEEYKRKRNFQATPEPEGKVAKAKGNSFVIQKHAATRLHYDFRLEMDGVLKSWAVPKGPSFDPSEKRLAVHVEDHPIDYGDFEGIIPKGQYGGGTVLLWDRGTWEPEGDPQAAYRKGHLKFSLDGEKLQGGWHLVRLHGDRAGEDKENWLLFKADDDEARPGSGEAIVEERPESVVTGRSLEEIAADRDRVWESNRPEEAASGDGFKEKVAAKAAKAEKKTAAKPAKKVAKKAEAASAADPKSIPGARKAAFPASVEAQLATLVDEAPDGDEWVFELKYDGYRALCHLQGGEASLITRNGKDWTDRFASVARVAGDLTARDAVLDGEVVVLEPNGTTSFQALQNALSEGRDKDLVYFVFDLLYLDGYDLRGAPLLARKEALRELLAGGEGGAVRYSDHVRGGGDAFFRQACGFGLEGVIAKHAERPYHSGRNKDWLKVKCIKRQELVVVGFTDPEKSRVGLGALLLAVREGKELVFAGKVGTGFDAKTLRTLRARLDKMTIDKPAFKNAPRGAEARRSHWVRAELVAEVAFTEWTRDGILRHPTFQGLREDKSPAEVVREEPASPPAPPARSQARVKPTPKSASKTATKSGKKPAVHPAPEETVLPGKKRGQREVEIDGVRITSPDKVLFPEQGITKVELAAYYHRIADWILPHLADRPLTLVRCPEGRAKQCFYQKHVNDQFPRSIRRVDVGDDQPYGALDSVEGLLSLVQMGVLEVHIWGAHRDKVELPDYVVFDLDPDEGLAWERVVQGALTVRERLGGLGLQTFLKTTGGKGLHVVVPLARRGEWDEVKAFTKAFTEGLVAAEPHLYTSKLTKVRREGKIFIDYLRNGRGATSIAAYSTRARPGAPVSVPLFWEELESDVRANTFTVKNLAERLEGLPSDPWDGFAKVRQSITAAMKKAVGMKD